MMTHSSPQFDTDVAIIGAGPIGIELAITLARMGVDYLLIEANQVGSAFMRWPTHTRFFSTPEHLALAGVPLQNVQQTSPTGEEYLAYLRMLVEMHDLKLRIYEPVTRIQPRDEGFLLQTAPRSGPRQMRARRVVVASGGMARPRRLHIPGEELPHVTHAFPGPHPYFRTRVLIVGGMNSALEAALRCWRAGARQVTLSYRQPVLSFDRVKPHLAMDMKDRLRKEEIHFLGGTLPMAITSTYVRLAATDDGVTPNGRVRQHETDFVILAIGFQADMQLLKEAGVALQGAAGAPVHNESTMETNVPGLYVAGTVAGGTQERFTYFISTSHDHVGRIVHHMTGQPPTQLGTVAARNNAVTYQEVKAN